MAAFVTVEDVEIALNETFDSGEVDRAQFLINSLSAYITSEIGIEFGEVEDAEEKWQADYLGIVEIYQPNLEISTVKDRLGGTAEYWFDGANTIYGLYPNQVVYVTLSYGLGAVPDDLKFVVIQAVGDAFNGYGTADLQSRTVGDTVDVYRGNVVSLFNALGGQAIIDSYKEQHTTWRVGPRYFGGDVY